MPVLHFSFGMLAGLAVAMFALLMMLARYVSSDLEAFTRWLDREPHA